MTTMRRAAVALTLSISVGLILLTLARSSPAALLVRPIVIGLAATTAFALFEVWPRSLPRWFERWVLQVVAVGVSVMITILVMHRVVPRGALPIINNHDLLLLTFAAILLAPWTALAAIVRQKEAFA